MSSKRNTLFACLVLVPLFQAISFISSRNPHGPSNAFNLSHYLLPTRAARLTHPIPKLMADADATYRAFLARQSRTLEAAVATYRERYKRDPPKGFDEWFAFAVENDVKVIDDYDLLVEDFEPFWSLSGQELRRRVTQIGLLPSVDLVRLRNGTAATLKIEKGFLDDEIKATTTEGPRAKGFRLMMRKYQDKLPDMDFPINAKAEGRILVPWEHKTYPKMTQQNSSAGIAAMLGGEFFADWRGDGNVWEAYRRTCHPSSPARRLFDSVRSSRSQSPSNPHSYFDASHKAAGSVLRRHSRQPPPQDPDFEFMQLAGGDQYDFCANPWARLRQGNFFSDWRTIPALYPIFSPGKVRGFSDIVIPSHYYYSSTPEYTYGWDEKNETVHDVDESEVPWEHKTDMIFWRGSTTGGGSTPAGFVRSYQRHRFLEMASQKNDTTQLIVFPDPAAAAAPDTYVTAHVAPRDMNEEMMDVAFTKAVGCAEFPQGCEGMRQIYRFAAPVPLGEHWKHKYLVDFDGMGYSARSMAFLASESAVIKSTIYREFYSDWIQPWLHYIPLSQSYKEIYNIHAFFSGPSPAMLRAARVNATTAGAGAAAAAAAGRRRPPTTTTTTSPAAAARSDGDARLRRIAEAGREWKRTVGRKVDMEAYVYRLCLEYARLYADDRDAMSYKR